MNTDGPKASPITTHRSPKATAHAFVLASGVIDDPAKQAFLARSYSHRQYPAVAWNDYLGILCSKLGYGIRDADRYAFLQAETRYSLAPGLCRTCYFLHIGVPVGTTSETCTKCDLPTVTGGLALANDAEYPLPYVFKDLML